MSYQNIPNNASSTTDSSPQISKFANIILEILKEGTNQEKIKTLDFLASQSNLCPNDAKAYLKEINRFLFIPDTEVRYYARKAYHHILNECKNINPESLTELSEDQNIEQVREENQKISTKEILLKKIYLPSRYIAFEAIERLTESGDITLFEPLKEFLSLETDLFKISFLLKRLSRINHPQVVNILTNYLDHSDYRVVANTLEGLYTLNTPELVSKYEELATKADDHRVRGCSIKALSKYNKDKAIELLKSMLTHDSIAYQDTALNLLKEIYDQQLENLLEIPLQSKYPTIRLKALELYKDLQITQNKTSINDLKKSIGTTSTNNTNIYISSNSDINLYSKLEKGFIVSLFIILIFLSAEIIIPSSIINKAFLGITILTCFILRENELLFTRVIATLAFLAGIIWADYSFLPLIGIVAVWLPFNSSFSHKNLFPKILLIWLFTCISIVIANTIQSPNIKLIEFLSDFVVNTSSNKDIIKLSITYKQIKLLIYFTILVGNLIILKIDDIFPTEESKQKKRLLIVFLFLIVSVTVIIFFQNLWLKLLLGLGNLELEKDYKTILPKLLSK